MRGTDHVICFAVLYSLAPEAQANRDEADGDASRIETTDMLPWTFAPRSTRSLVVSSFGGYDAHVDTSTFSTSLAYAPIDRLTLRIVAAHGPPSGKLTSSAGALVGILREDGAGIALAVGGEYTTHGWSQVPAAIATVVVGRTIGSYQLVSNTAVGFGLEEAELYGDLRVAVLRLVTRRLTLGLDSQARIDLERDDDEPPGEAEWDLRAGPVATYAWRRFAITAAAGISASQLRGSEMVRAGPAASLGFGAAF